MPSSRDGKAEKERKKFIEKLEWAKNKGMREWRGGQSTIEKKNAHGECTDINSMIITIDRWNKGLIMGNFGHDFFLLEFSLSKEYQTNISFILLFDT